MNNINIEIKWAVFFAIMTLVWMLLEKLSGLHGRYIDYHLYLTNLFAIPAIWFMVLALKDKKKNFYNGSMTYKQGLISGIVLSLLIAVLSPLTQWIISNVITPEYFPNVIKRSVELGYYQTTAEAQAHFNYRNYAISSTIFAFVSGVVTTAVVMLFLRTRKK
ncbi:DUF4199 domain-containing protein [Sphingobacterium sp. N143]|uniref:DUF4199 domain-containing protein n=1 Tax=Sphingobacterium sp. N143 TaxID=2746727 RepID=UPI0025750A8D|nr:DUF4199 domain-containing protein [Sphingobacterium sp. N143]MDM1294611.1 DUF4199 domain-containing protein [Sphingobacterium sp. N143]